MCVTHILACSAVGTTIAGYACLDIGSATKFLWRRSPSSIPGCDIEMQMTQQWRLVLLKFKQVLCIVSYFYTVYEYTFYVSKDTELRTSP